MITEQDLTIYHKIDKNWFKFNLKGTLRDTSIKNRTQSGVDTTDKGVARVFEKIDVNTGDIVVNKKVEDTEDISLTYLKEKYGRHNVYQVKSVDYFLLGTKLDHIKMGII